MINKKAIKAIKAANDNNDSTKTSTHPETTKPIEKTMNIDEIFINDPDGYAAKFSPAGRKLIIDYLNTRPMIQVEPFFVGMFDIEDKDPFFKIEWVKNLFDYLKNSCPRGEAKNVIMGLAANTILYKTNKKVEEEQAALKQKNEKAN